MTLITPSTIQRTLTMMDTSLVTSWLGGQQRQRLMRRLDWDLEDMEAMGATEDMVWEDLVMALDTAGTDCL